MAGGLSRLAIISASSSATGRTRYLYFEAHEQCRAGDKLERAFLSVTARSSLPLFVSLAFVSSVLARDAHWTAKYKRFGGVRPTAKVEQVTREVFEETVIQDARLEANSLQDAIPKIRMLAREAGSKWGISLIIIDPDYSGYSKRLRLQARKLTLAGFIDELAVQGDFYWDFSAIKLTIRPTKKP